MTRNILLDDSEPHPRHAAALTHNTALGACS